MGKDKKCQLAGLDGIIWIGRKKVKISLNFSGWGNEKRIGAVHIEGIYQIMSGHTRITFFLPFSGGL
jgi:hypothetical protein